MAIGRAMGGAMEGVVGGLGKNRKLLRGILIILKNYERYADPKLREVVLLGLRRSADTILVPC